MAGQVVRSRRRGSQGDVFDAVMNYRWYTPTRSFFAGAPPFLTASRYAASLDSLAAGIGPSFQRAMMNLTASHDTPRFGTSVYNPGRYKYRNTPREDSAYRIDRPDERTRRIQQLILVQQFTCIGAPHIWNGDEVGMWGADDPDERKPMVWADLRYEDEITDPFGRPRRRDRVVPDTALFRVYRDLIALRKQHLRLFVDGTLRWLVTDDARGLLAYERVLGDQRAIVAFNISDAPHEISVAAEGRYRARLPGGRGGDRRRRDAQGPVPPRVGQGVDPGVSGCSTELHHGSTEDTEVARKQLHRTVGAVANRLELIRRLGCSGAAYTSYFCGRSAWDSSSMPTNRRERSRHRSSNRGTSPARSGSARIELSHLPVPRAGASGDRAIDEPSRLAYCNTKGFRLAKGYIIDLLIDNSLIVEIKSVDKLLRFIPHN